MKFEFEDLGPGPAVLEGTLYTSDEDFYALTNGYMKPLLEALPEDQANAVRAAASTLEDFFHQARACGKLEDT